MKKLVKMFFSATGNARACLFTEPLWAIPFNLYMPFFTVFMSYLGILDRQIGLLLALQSFAMIPMALLGGIITDKFGRRWTTFVFDMFAWGVSSLLFALAQNFWWFLVGMLINSVQLVTHVSWESLWLDETDPKFVGPFFDLLHITGLLAIFVSPISGHFVAIYGVVPVIRVIYWFATASFILKFVLTLIYTKETEIGKIRMKETKNIKTSSLLKEYGATVKLVIKTPKKLKAVTMQSSMNIINIIIINFVALYLVGELYISPEFLAYFPILRGSIMLLFLLFAQQWLNKFKSKNIMKFGIITYIVAMVILLIAPRENMFMVLLYVLLEGTAFALLITRVSAMAATAIDSDDRARQTALFRGISFGLGAPFGLLIGYMSELNRRLPFLLGIAIFILMISMFVFEKKTIKPTI